MKSENKVIPVRDINELKNALDSFSEYQKNPQKSVNIEITPHSFSKEMLQYMESEEWLLLNNVYSKLVQKKPQYNLKKSNLNLAEFILLCSDFIEIKQNNRGTFIRPKNWYAKIDVKKSSGSNKQIAKVGLFRRLISRVISGQIRLLEKKVKDLSNQNTQLLVEKSSNESEIVELSKEKNLWKKRHDSLRKEKRDKETNSKDSLIKSLRDKNLVLHKRIRDLELDNISISSISESIKESDPKSITEVIEISEKNLTSLRFFDEAKKSAKGSPYHRPDLILKSLSQMDEAAKKWFEMELGSGSYETLLRESYTLDIAESDSVYREFGTTDKYGKWRKIEMKCHVKFGVQRDPKKTLRIYYKTDRENQSIYIGWCGQHP
tara:strand:+ start:7540 stop:8670 length:1131 start_codon:yes stop_codon:yes gene_type:complete